MKRATYVRMCAAMLVTALALAIGIIPQRTVLAPLPVSAQGTNPGVPGALPLQVSKIVRDVTTGSSFGSIVNANPGNTLQYAITVSNPAGNVTANGVMVSDVLQGNQSFAGVASCSPACFVSGNAIVFNVGTLPAGTGSTSLTFMTTLSGAAAGQAINNTATATSTNIAGVSSSPQTVVLVNGGAFGTTCGLSPCTTCGFSPCATTCGFSPCTNTCGFSPCSNTCGFSPCTNTCGGFSPCSNTCGFNTCGTTCGFSPCSSPCGACAAATTCTNFCSPTTCGFSCVPTSCAASNCFTIGTGQSLVCGTVTSYTPATAGSPGMLVINGMQITLMPFLVPSGAITVGQPACINVTMGGNLAASALTVTSNLPNLNCGCAFTVNGVPSCYLLSPLGTVQGSLSAVPIAAKPAEDATHIHRIGASYMS